MNLTQAVDHAVHSLRRDVPGYVASGVVDLSTGLLLAGDVADGHRHEDLELAAASAVDLLHGPAPARIAGAWQDPGAGHDVRELVLQTDDRVHLLVRSRAENDLVVLVVCHRPVNLGLLLTTCHESMAELAAPDSPAR